jgi:hypothetical protein
VSSIEIQKYGIQLGRVVWIRLYDTRNSTDHLRSVGVCLAKNEKLPTAD